MWPPPRLPRRPSLLAVSRVAGPVRGRAARAAVAHGMAAAAVHQRRVRDGAASLAGRAGQRAGPVTGQQRVQRRVVWLLSLREHQRRLAIRIHHIQPCARLDQYAAHAQVAGAGAGTEVQRCAAAS